MRSVWVKRNVHSISVCITWQWYCTAILVGVWWGDTDVSSILSIISIKIEKLVNSNNNRSKSEVFSLLWDVSVSDWLLNIFCLKLILNLKFLNNFDTVLYQFLKTGTSDRTLIGFDQLLKFLGFSLYPFSFFLYSPFKSFWNYDWKHVKFYFSLTCYLPCTFLHI